MNIQDRNRLRKNRCNLVDIDPDRIKHNLIQEGLFTPQQMDDLLLSQPTPKDRMGSLLTKMEEKGPNAYSAFRDVLLQFHYQALVDALDRTPLTATDEMDGAPLNQTDEPAKKVNIDISGHGSTAVVCGAHSTITIGKR
ncbi:uncharacterized protein LOC117294910 [Asterias rubens]|uniref:uncharacterized protein LOC117294910 n=1 Tax=Asterias rubens TaxID=7604 RepID=UPI0014555CB3|nr:uncharacterized protein LOC117294910 [Asterias rubens]